jgi:hypothetical protein
VTAGIRVAGSSIAVEAGQAAPHLAEFVARISEPFGRAPSHVLDVLPGKRPRLAVDAVHRHAVLHLPADAGVRLGQQRVEIGLLQAAARSLAAMCGDALVLLHGSATTVDGGRSAVAVLDGGLGQGKTSLAVGLARAGGRLLVDEFTFAVMHARGLAVVPLSRLPWHIRRDMTPALAPRHDGTALLYGPDLPGLGWAGTHPIPLGAVLIPDQHASPGQVRRLCPGDAGQLLHAAVEDHAAKLHNPALDHVSIFASAADVTVQPAARVPTDDVLARLAGVPVFAVGIGGPGDVSVAVDAARAALAAR